jgi:MtrB/PioB family decaheme-associated outer membrane protein
MRNRLMMIGTAALLLASAALAGAQDKPQEGATPSSGTIDIGGRFTSTDGDEARYERYRDLRDGVNANFQYSKEATSWTFDFLAKNIGYRDGRYELSFNSRRVKFTALFDQTPLNYAYYATTPFDCTAGSCTLDAGLRTQVQNGKAVGIPQNVGQLATGSIYNSIARPFDMQSRRDTFKADLRISATDNLDFLFGLNTYKRTGDMPYGAGFAFNNAAELPIVIDNRETDWKAGVEWASHQGMFHADYQHSKFDQNIPYFTWDNPQQATDYCRYGNPANPPGTCYDPSGYTNGNGPAYGRMSLPPSNSVDTVNLMGMVKLPGRTSGNGSFSMGANHQDEALIPWTTNSSINTAAVWAAFPELAELPRESAQMRVDYATATGNVSSRAIRNVTLTGRYRFYSRNDFTRPFDAVEYVRFDAVPEETGGESEPYAINRNTIDVNAAFTGLPYSTLRVGYVFDQYEHGIRATQGWQDKTARISYDLVGTPWLTLRALYEHTNRDTINLNVESLVEAGMQPAARFYDEAARKRDRATFIAELTPASSVGVSFSLATGKDDYQEGDAAQEFGLLDNKNTAWTVGVSYAPSDRVNIGADYGHEEYDATQQSRNANPAPDPSWTDPNRNWTLANDETVNTFSAYVDLIKALAKTDIHAAYTYSDSDQAFVHGGPRIASLSAANQFVALPNVTNTWQQLMVDVRYSISKSFGIGLSYLFEKLDVEDYATINTAGPQTLPRPELGAQTDTARIDWLGSITTGYAARPYKGQTGIVRVFYVF